MAFSGRSSLLSLIEQLIEVNGGHQVTAGTVRPILVLEGVGGAGRSEVLDHTWRKWGGRTPTARIDPLAVEGDPHSMREVLAAVMLGLTTEVPDFAVSFPRVVLANIAMEGPIEGADAAARRRAMVERINGYRDRGAVQRLITGLFTLGATYIPVPGVQDLVPVAAEELTQRLKWSRLRAKLVWDEPLEWFGHQDQDFRHKPVDALITLSVQARQERVTVRQDVDHLLLAGLLADLRESLDRTLNRHSNAVVLLDNGDAPSAREFVRSLVGVRNELRHKGIPDDPLVVITTSGGRSGHAAAEASRHDPGWSESELERLGSEEICGRRPAAVRVGLDGLAVEDVQQLARSKRWPGSLGSSDIAKRIHRLTGGHAEATGLLLNRLEDQPAQVDDLDQVLRSQVGDREGTLERYLLERVAAELTPRGHIDERLRDDLITIAAARDQKEARVLAPLLGDRVNAELVLFTSTTLWSARSVRGEAAMMPFVRFLLLRALADRPVDRLTGWPKIFRMLEERLSDDDLGGRLHHQLALGYVDDVVTVLIELLPVLPTKKWLAMLDEAVSTPNLAPPDIPPQPRT
ncbi:hypothetical protein, partial [Actinomadura rubrisoli]